MLANFDKTFKNNSKLNTIVPDAVLESLNRNLPNGFRYINNGDGMCILYADEFKIDLKNIKFPKKVNLDSEQFNSNNLFKYLYLTQQKAQIIPDKDGCININNSSIKIDDIINYPLGNFTVEKIDGLYLAPPPLPEAFPLSFSIDDYNKTIYMQQVPYDSLTSYKFESLNNGCLNISYLVSDQIANFSLKANISLSNAISINDIVTSFKLYNGFFEGKVKISGHILGISDDIISYKKIPDETIEFWEKVLKIEKFIGVNYNPKIEIEMEDAVFIEELYSSLILNRPYKKYIDINSIDIDASNEVNNITSLKDIVGNEWYFEYTQEIVANLFGVKINFYILTAIFNTEVKDVIYNNSKYSVILKAKDNKKSYSSSILFLQEENIQKYKGEHKDYIEILKMV